MEEFAKDEGTKHPGWAAYALEDALAERKKFQELLGGSVGDGHRFYMEVRLPAQIRVYEQATEDQHWGVWHVKRPSYRQMDAKGRAEYRRLTELGWRYSQDHGWN